MLGCVYRRRARQRRNPRLALFVLAWLARASLAFYSVAGTQSRCDNPFELTVCARSVEIDRHHDDEDHKKCDCHDDH